MRITIVGTGLPGRSCGLGPQRLDGHGNVHVAVQRRGKPAELLGLVPGDAPEASWTLDATVTVTPADAIDLRGPYIQGPPGGRFIYLSWVTVDQPGEFTMFRRAKLWLEAVPPPVLLAAVHQGALVGRLGLTDEQGLPRCASVRPPLIDWSSADA